MRTILIPALLAFAVAPVAATAGDRNRAELSTSAPKAEQIRRNLEELGYRVSHMEVEHGRVELRAANDAPYSAKLIYDAASGELLRASLR